MSQLKGAMIIGQSGGPTSVINASTYGAIDAALKSGVITRVLGAQYGIQGVLNDSFFDMSEEDPNELALLKYTPSSFLGSCRYKLADPDKDDTDYKRILEIFKKYDVRYFFYNGGNDSMDTCNKISKYMQKVGYECRVMGIPKTIDNDLVETDHCPGYGSSAKYLASSIMEVCLDSRVYDIGQVTVLEIMGRHAGWLTAAAALANYGGAGPDLIYLPELTFDMDSFLHEVSTLYAKNKNVVVAVSEGICDKDGRFIQDVLNANIMGGQKDSFGHTQLGGLAASLASLVKEKTGAKCRGIEFSLLQRCASHIASKTDIEESFLCGQTATLKAIEGYTDKMVALERQPGSEYKCVPVLKDLQVVANKEKKVPLEWISADGKGLTSAFIDYALPLIQGDTELPKENGLPRFARLKKQLISK